METPMCIEKVICGVTDYSSGLHSTNWCYECYTPGEYPNTTQYPWLPIPFKDLGFD